MNWNTKRSFTFLEVMTVVVIIAILAALVVPLFRKTMEKSRERLAVTTLKMILAGENLYRLNFDHYFPPESGTVISDLDEINRYLNLDLSGKYFTYEIESRGPYDFEIRAKKDGKTIYYITPDGTIHSGSE